MSSSATAAWLKAASASLIAFGVLIALAALPATAGPTEFLVALILGPADGSPGVAGAETRMLRAISGGLLVGWGITLWLIVARLLPRDPALARRLILSGVGAWFVVDSLGSLAAGAPANAALNVAFLLAFAVPLWRPPRTAAG